ncbi:MAG: LptA/OstA family protein, partial [Candidatus Obscuribacterales bacterium]|nr:LptA/OstA family protein [Candidatus Obscuribacterales bacterium]
PGAPGAPGAAGGPPSGPIDITANEQEFAGDSVIAKGNVRVVYKDSVILAPLATLYKDPSGNPSRAVFTGHPRLTQGHSKIDANTLVFEMAVNKIVATGNAHSEVDIPEDDGDATPAAGAANSKVATNPTQSNVDPDNEDANESPAVTPAPVVAEAPAKKGEKKASKPPEKIITDSEKQEYDSATGRFDAFGHVKVVNGDITVFADKLQLVYGALNNKPETAIFTGHVTANQGKNTTMADNMNYSLSTKRLQATGNVKSKVIQEKTAPAPTKKNKEDVEDPTARANFGMAPAVASNQKSLSGGAKSTALVAPLAADDNKPFWVYSDAQDYSRDNGRLSAHGNCRVVSGEMYGVGPSIVLVKKPDGRADKVYFKGRSQISQPGRRWIADEITYIVDEKLVVANGHAKAMILGDPNGTVASKSKVLPDTPTKTAPTPARERDTRLAEPNGKRSISSTTSGAPQ